MAPDLPEREDAPAGEKPVTQRGTASSAAAAASQPAQALSAEELQARPATFGIVLILGLALFSMITYVFSQVNALSKELKDYQLRQLEKAAEIQKVLGALEARQGLNPEPTQRVASGSASRPSATRIRALAPALEEQLCESYPAPNIQKQDSYPRGSLEEVRPMTVSNRRLPPASVQAQTSAGEQ